MSRAPDVWYIRLPDGRVLRANSTRSVRHNLHRGQIPPGSRVRRSAEDEWVSLDLTAEFADLVNLPSTRGAAAAAAVPAGEPPATLPFALDKAGVSGTNLDS